MTPSQFSIHLKDIERRIKRAVNDDLPRLAGSLAAEEFTRNFNREGFFDNKWKPSKRKTKSKNATDRARPTLTGKGVLKSGILASPSPGKAVVSSDTGYGKYHNEGIGKQPKRQFIGSHKILEAKIRELIDREISGIIR
jgi:phage gpG-like protein